MHQATYVLILLLLVSGFTLFYMIRSKHIEQMTRIEHGLDDPNPNAFRDRLISFGTFLIGLALGLFTSFVVSKLFNTPDHIFIPGFLLLFGGGSLIFIAKRERK